MDGPAAAILSAVTKDKDFSPVTGCEMVERGDDAFCEGRDPATFFGASAAGGAASAELSGDSPTETSPVAGALAVAGGSGENGAPTAAEEVTAVTQCQHFIDQVKARSSTAVQEAPKTTDAPTTDVQEAPKATDAPTGPAAVTARFL